jgi:hypothetical protein
MDWRSGSNLDIYSQRVDRNGNLGPTAVEEHSSGIPAAFRLGQNYPNPFNPTTIISYALPQPSKVRLSVFNMLGQEVLTLVNKFQDAGYKSVSLDASKLTSGVYFYRIVAEASSKGIPLGPSGQASNFTETKKLVLLR